MLRQALQASLQDCPPSPLNEQRVGEQEHTLSQNSLAKNAINTNVNTGLELPPILSACVNMGYTIDEVVTAASVMHPEGSESAGECSCVLLLERFLLMVCILSCQI